MTNTNANTQNKLTQWAINKIKSEYPDDVALLIATEGGNINGDAHGEPFDYFIPATERGYELAQTFIINCVGNDLYPRSWERTERTADLDDLATPCLGNAKILYARSQEDEERFETIRQKLFDNLANPEFMYKKALENLDVAMNFYKTMMFEERTYRVRGLAGYIHRYLTISVACLNNTYRKDWHNGVLREISTWKALPERFTEYYQAILAATSASELKSLAHLLITSVRKFISGYNLKNTVPAKKPNYTQLADWYHELRTGLNRLYYFCSVNNSDAAFCEACQLQSEMDIVGEEFFIKETDLLGYFDHSNLESLSARASELESIIIRTIESNGATIKRYDNIDTFLSAEGFHK